MIGDEIYITVIVPPAPYKVHEIAIYSQKAKSTQKCLVLEKAVQDVYLVSNFLLCISHQPSIQRNNEALVLFPLTAYCEMKRNF